MNKNHISNSEQRCDFALYLLIIIDKTIIKANAIIVTNTKKNNYNKKSQNKYGDLYEHFLVKSFK